MRIWIDIEDSSGTKVGGGPILSAVRWRSIKRLDKAGTFEFELPAGDQRATALTAKRVVRCWGIVNGTLTALGAGIIDQVKTRPGSPSMLTVSGDDLLRELTWRSVGLLDLTNEDLRTPDSLVHFNGPSTYSTLSNAIDDNGATKSTIYITADDFVYVGDDTPFERVIFNIGPAVNAVTARLQGEYWDGSAWTAMQIEDGTAVSGVCLAQDGTITVERRANWATTAVNGVSRYWVRLATNVSINANAVDVVEVDVATTVLSTTALADIMAFAPAGWSLDTVAGYGATATAIYARFAGESVLTALVKVGEALGEHFHLGTGRQVVWTRTDMAASGVRAVRVASATAAEGKGELALIVELERTSNAFDLISRVYPFGAGDGQARLTLAAGSDAAPTGYTVDRVANYLKRDASEAAYGRIERYVQWKEVSPISNTDADLQAAANALQAAAYAYLSRTSEPYESYRLRVAKLEQVIEPGQTLRVIYDEWDAGYHAIAINADLVVLESTAEVNKDGIRTVALQVATADRWPVGDQGQIVSQLQQASIFQAHPQMSPNTYTTHYQPHLDADTPATIRFRLGREVVQVQEVALEFQLPGLISTVKTIAGVTTTTAGGGAATVTSASGGSSTPTSGAGGAATPTSGASSASSSASGGDHNHVLDIHAVPPYANDTPLYLDTGDRVLTAGDHNDYTFHTSGSEGAHSHDITHTHTVTIGDHTHAVTIVAHTHDVVVPNHTHDLTPVISTSYGIYEAGAPSTFVIGDLEFQVNDGSWLTLATYAADLGDGWYALDLTSFVSNATTFRPLQMSNQLVIRRKTSGSFASRQHCQVDGLLQVRNIIQSVAYV